jgi:hypothetical protein
LWISRYKEVKHTYSIEEHAAWDYNVRAGTSGELINTDLTVAPDGFVMHVKKSQPSKSDCGTGIKKFGKKWRARLGEQYLGMFDTVEQALSARKTAERIRDESEAKERADHVIRRNSANQAIIPCSNKPDKFIICSDTDYHALRQRTWTYFEQTVRHGDNGKTTIPKICTRVNQVTVSIHRFLMNTTKPSTGQFVVDHINHDRLDNRRENLRWESSSVNNHNRVKKKGASSQYHYVHRIRDRAFWLVQLIKDRETHYFGRYPDERVAAWAGDMGAKLVWGEVASLNNIPKPDNWEWNATTRRAQPIVVSK